MHSSIVNNELFATAVTGWLSAMLHEHSYDGNTYQNQFDVDDCSVETLAFVAGECLALLKKASDIRGGLVTLPKGTAELLCSTAARNAMGFGREIRYLKVNGLDEVDLETLDLWQQERWALRNEFNTLTLYKKDKKLFVEGFDKFKPKRVKMSLSEGAGRFGAMFEFSAEVVSIDDLALRTLKMVQDERWTKSWLRGYEEIPL